MDGAAGAPRPPPPLVKVFGNGDRPDAKRIYIYTKYYYLYIIYIYILNM